MRRIFGENIFLQFHTDWEKIRETKLLQSLANWEKIRETKLLQFPLIGIKYCSPKAPPFFYYFHIMQNHL